MAVFALEGGQLVPAQLVDLTGTTLATESLAAIRERVIDILDVPLFPIAWQTEQSHGHQRESLIALDPTGQITTVEVIEHLDNTELLAALARTGRHGGLTRQNIAHMYGPGARTFPRNWQTFLDTCEPHPAPGPRLFLVVLSIDSAVRPAVQALSGAGLHVQQAFLHDGGQQILVSLEEVKATASAFGTLSRRSDRREVLPGSTHVSHHERAVPTPSNRATYSSGSESVPESQPVPRSDFVPARGAVPVPEVVPMSAPADSAVSAPSAPSPERPRRRSRFFRSEERSEGIESASDQMPARPVKWPPLSPESPAQSVSEPLTTVLPTVSTPTVSKPNAAATTTFVPSTPQPQTPAPSTPRPQTPAPYKANPAAGMTMYEQSLFARRRLEDRIWEGSAPQRSTQTPTFLSEAKAAQTSSQAVEEAAEERFREAGSRLLKIARSCNAPFTVVWQMRRRGVEYRATVTAWGTIVLSNGAVFTDPSLAAAAASGRAHVDGWSVWKNAAGLSLGEL